MAAHRIETERLVLREWEDGDDDALVEVFAKPEVWHFPFRRGFEPWATRWWVERERQRWTESGYGSFACIHKPSDRIIGYIGAAPLTWLPEFMPAADIGWRLDPEFWGQGLATEGATAALSYAFKALPVGDRVVAIHEVGNDASGRIMMKLGMRFVAEVEHPEYGTPQRVYERTRGR